jgi:hypothetical protein
MERVNVPHKPIRQSRAKTTGLNPVRRKRTPEVTTATRTGLLADLAALRGAVANTATLKTILDDGWFASVERAIMEPVESQPADPTGILADFCHPFRGARWFEENQALAFAGRYAEISEGGKSALAFAGLDPLRKMLPKIEERLTAFAALPFKRDVVAKKLAELRAAHNNPSFKNHLFELIVLGDLALRGVLVDIEEPSASVDGVIRIDDRDILVEATNTSQQVIPYSTSRVFSVDPNVGIDQVALKVSKKVAEGKQLAKADGRPAVLFLARRYMGADRAEANIALHECFANPGFATLSGVVLSDTYRLHRTSWHPGRRPNAPLSETEAERLNAWYGN